jgi:hypothetical protein
MILRYFSIKSFLSKDIVLIIRSTKGGIKMTSENVEKAKADAKKGMANIGNKMAHDKADCKG